MDQLPAAYFSLAPFGTSSLKVASTGLRIAGTFVGAFGLLALVLAAVGIYGVTAYTTQQRTHEIGIRMALGAQARGVQNLFLRRGLLLTGVAFLMGLPVALLVSKLFNSILYGIQPHDLITFTTVPLVLASVAALAAFLPARRASRVDPATTLRSE